MTKTHQVRNGATLAFAALLTKVVGYMNAANPAAGGASRRAVAGDEFFRRFPATHPFLLAELTEAAERLESQTDGAVHPALYPILALLSRLRPSSGAPARESARRLKDTKANKGEPPDGDDGDRREIEGSGAGASADLDLDPAAFAPAVRRCARGRVHAVRAAAARALAPLIRAQDVARALAETFRDAAAFGDDWTSSVSPPSGTSRVSSRARRPRLGYNAAHGALLCAAELLGAEGPAEAGTAAHAMAAVETAAEGLSLCSYLADPEASPVAAAAAAWALCAHETLRLARLTRTRLERERAKNELKTAKTANSISEEMSDSFFSASRRLTRLARAACDVPATARGFVAASGGATPRGARLAPASPSRPGTSSGSSEPRVFAASRRWTRRALESGNPARTERPAKRLRRRRRRRKRRFVPSTRHVCKRLQNFPERTTRRTTPAQTTTAPS